MLELLEALDGAAAPGDWLAHLRVMLCYVACRHSLPQLSAPQKFTEWVQWRKLYDRDPAQKPLMDKLASKAMATRRLGPEWTVPTLWTGSALPTAPPFAFPAIVKARHGCNQYRALRSAPSGFEWQELQALAKRWTAKPYGGWLDEWAYDGVPRGVLAEPLLRGDGEALPLDYKIYVFGGQATHVQVHLGRASEHRWILHDRDFRPLVAADEHAPRPASLAAMLDAAEELAQGFDFLRVDFYEVEGRPLFGEFCLYPGSGLDPFAAEWIDLELGRLWSDAAASRQPAAVSWTKTSSRSASRVVTSSIA